MFPITLGSLKVVQIDSINTNRQFAGYEPPVVVSKLNKTITVNLSSAGKEVFLYLAAFYLPDFKTQLIHLAEEVIKKSLEDQKTQEALRARRLAEEKHKAKVEAVRIKMAAEAVALAEEEEIRKEIAAEGKKGKK